MFSVVLSTAYCYYIDVHARGIYLGLRVYTTVQVVGASLERTEYPRKYCNSLSVVFCIVRYFVRSRPNTAVLCSTGDVRFRSPLAAAYESYGHTYYTCQAHACLRESSLSKHVIPFPLIAKLGASRRGILRGKRPSH